MRTAFRFMAVICILLVLLVAGMLYFGILRQAPPAPTTAPAVEYAQKKEVDEVRSDIAKAVKASKVNRTSIELVQKEIGDIKAQQADIAKAAELRRRIAELEHKIVVDKMALMQDEITDLRGQPKAANTAELYKQVGEIRERITAVERRQADAAAEAQKQAQVIAEAKKVAPPPVEENAGPLAAAWYVNVLLKDGRGNDKFVCTGVKASDIKQEGGHTRFPCAGRMMDWGENVLFSYAYPANNGKAPVQSIMPLGAVPGK